MSEEELVFRPCIGCGYCCKKVPCILGEGTPCKELVFKDGRHWCGLVLESNGPGHKMIKNSLHIGAGCCSSLNSDRKEALRQPTQGATKSELPSPPEGFSAG